MYASVPAFSRRHAAWDPHNSDMKLSLSQSGMQLSQRHQAPGVKQRMCGSNLCEISKMLCSWKDAGLGVLLRGCVRDRRQGSGGGDSIGD
jgi:hypothetical protein